MWKGLYQPSFLSDVAIRPGAPMALITTFVAGAVAALNQTTAIQRTGWLPHYIWLHTAKGSALVMVTFLSCAAIPCNLPTIFTGAFHQWWVASG